MPPRTPRALNHRGNTVVVSRGMWLALRTEQASLDFQHGQGIIV